MIENGVEMPEEQLTHKDIAGLTAEVAALRVLIETEGVRCPYREAIGKASNNVRRLDGMEERVRETELRMAAISGISGGSMAALVTIIGKALGWI